ncbi:MAG: SET domain-containing protein, partial [Gammaproteobacteria bacterium]
CTPGLRFALGYLSAVLMPDRGHMGDWYYRRHWGWLPCAHLLRWVRPLVRRIPSLWTWFAKIETRKSPMHGIGVFTARAVREKEVIARYQGKPVDHNGLYVVRHEHPSGQQQRYEITGKLRFLNHSCRPNAELSGFELIALRPIRAGQEITIDYGEGTCDCSRSRREIEGPPRNSTAADAA